MRCALLGALLAAVAAPPPAGPSPLSPPTYDIWNDGALLPEKHHAVPERHHHRQQLKNNTAATDNRRGKSLAMFNFFSFGEEYECQAEDGRRSGLCLNPYSCRRRDGVSSGYCAHGFGVCCVFTVTCGKEIRNNITYFISPQFPSLSRSLGGCSLMVKKMDGASQLRLDFIHFNLGQPNRLTGECDSDAFTVTGGNSRVFKICGQNNDQHVYYDLDKTANRVLINLKMNKPNLQRFWEIKVTQIPFAQRAPAGCMQYFTSKKGFIQTLNYAENGRHLAQQDYKACVRPGRGMCSIAYEPCDGRSFRIGPNAALETPGNGLIGGGGGPGGVPGGGLGGGPGGSFGGVGPGGSFGGVGGPATFGGAGSEGIEGSDVGSQAGDPGAADELIYSGDGSPDTNDVSEGRQFTRWSPYAQHLGGSKNDQQLWRYWGYGNYGQGVSSFGRQRCQDRIITPCDGEDFLEASPYSPGVCDPFHCGSTFCPNIQSGQPCRFETSAKPFEVGIKFGPPTAKSNPEDNIGMCLKYEQLPCVE